MLQKRQSVSEQLTTRFCSFRLIEEQTCSDINDCFECTSRKRCSWCLTSHTCMASGQADCVDDLAIDQKSCGSLMKKDEKSTEKRACGLATNCFACRRMTHCVWLAIESKRVCVSQSDHGKLVIECKVKFASLAMIIEQHNRRQAAERLHFDDMASSHNHIPLLSASGSKIASQTNAWSPFREFHSSFGAMSVFNSTTDQCPEACANHDKCSDCVRSQCM